MTPERNSQNQKRQQFFPAELPSLVFQSLILLLDEVLSPLDTNGISIRTEGNVHAEDIELKAVHTDIGRLRFGRKLANRREQRVDAAVNLFLSVLLLLQRLLQSLVLLVESVYFFLQGLVFLAEGINLAEKLNHTGFQEIKKFHAKTLLFLPFHGKIEGEKKRVRYSFRKGGRRVGGGAGAHLFGNTRIKSVCHNPEMFF